MLKIVRQSEFIATPWKNGGGITREALRKERLGSGAFLWRVSVATIDASGPFSDFAGYRRTLVLLDGDGVRLSFSDRTVTELRQAGDLATFDGALSTDCQLLGGPCVDLNLMAADSVDVTAAGVVIIETDMYFDDARATTLLVFCIDGSLQIALGDESATVLDKWDVAAAYSGAASRDAAPVPLRVRLAPGEPGSAPTVFIARLID